jgi:hypothetical protein
MRGLACRRSTLVASLLLGVVAVALAGLPQASPGGPLPADPLPASFLLGGQMPLRPYPRALAVGDFDRDGRLDLAVVNGSRATVSILFGTGTGRFVAPHAVRVPADADAVAVADLDGDRRQDLVVGATTHASGSISVLLGRGDGTFGERHTYPLGYGAGIRNAATVEVADVNGDRRPDVVTARGSRMMVLLGRGDGTCRAARSSVADADGSIASFALGRLERDALPDVVAGSQEGVNTPAGALTIMSGAGAGGYRRAGTTRTGLLIPEKLALRDVDHDGARDLLVADTADVADYGSGGEDHAAIVVSLGRGDGGFSRPAEYDFGDMGPSALELADFNGDGNVDLLVASADGLYLLQGNGDGSFGEADELDATRRTGGALVAVGDFDTDGRPDLAVAAASGHQLSIFLGRAGAAGARHD